MENSYTWKSVKRDGFPTDEHGKYLVWCLPFYKEDGHCGYTIVAGFSKCLSDFDENFRGKDYPGFRYCNDEWGWGEAKSARFWTEIQEPSKEEIRKEFEEND